MAGQDRVQLIKSEGLGAALAVVPRVVYVGETWETGMFTVPNDEHLDLRMELFERSRDVLTLACDIPGTTPILLAEVLARTVEGKDLYATGIGAFFFLYGRLEGALGLADKDSQKKMKDKMISLIKSDDGNVLRTYKKAGGGTEQDVPLPLYVRNVLAHGGTNSLNSLKPTDVESAIKLLEKWLVRLGWSAKL